MAQNDVRTVMAQLKKGELHNLYYLYGQNVSGVETLTKKIIKKAVGENEEFSLNKLNGKSLNISDFRDMAEMLPMMSEYNCILVNDYNCEDQREDVNKRLIDALKEIPSQTVVIFNITGFEIKTKKVKGKLEVADKNKKLVDFISKNGIVCEQGIRTPAELAKDITARVSAKGGMISVESAQELASMCLSDTLMIENEIDKLCAYANGREITSVMLRELVSQQSDLTVYNLANAVSSFNRKKAFEILDDLLSRFPKNEDRRYLFSVVSGSFTDMYRAVCARQSGRGVADVASDFGYKWEFMVRNSFRDSSGMSLRRLRECMEILRDTAIQLNSTSADEKIVLETAVTKMLMTKN